MPATIEIHGVRAEIRDGQWKTKDRKLLAILQALAPIYGISGSIPDPDMYLASDAATKLGGQVVQHTPERRFDNGMRRTIEFRKEKSIDRASAELGLVLGVFEQIIDLFREGDCDE